MDLLLRKLRSF